MAHLMKQAAPRVLLRHFLNPSVVASAAYHPKVIDHYENPRNVGSWDKSEDNVGTGLVGAPACGDVMKLQVKVDKDVSSCTVDQLNFLRIG